jgi:hypothetical protein
MNVIQCPITEVSASIVPREPTSMPLLRQLKTVNPIGMARLESVSSIGATLHSLPQNLETLRLHRDLIEPFEWIVFALALAPQLGVA